MALDIAAKDQHQMDFRAASITYITPVMTANHSQRDVAAIWSKKTSTDFIL